MTEVGIRTRRNFPAETWAVVRDAYLGGETAESISRRLGLSVNTIRKRATRCGWTHAAHARAINRTAVEIAAADVDPQTARRAAVSQAASMIASGRATEATALLKAAEALGRFADMHPEPAPVITDAQDIDREAELRTAWELLDLTIQERASALATDLISERGVGAANHVAFALRWRAEMLGPAIAHADREREYASRTRPPTRNPDGSLRPAREYVDMLFGYLRSGMRENLGLPARAPDQRVEGLGSP